MLSFLRLLLYPFAMLYAAVVWLRNKFFDWGWTPSQSFGFPVISIGNITVGGTGKTPHTEYLVRLLGHKMQLAMVSRGYLRKTEGVVVASAQSTSLDVGDEPLQLKNKFPDLHVVVAEKRVDGISACIVLSPKPSVVLLDDAHQHRYVKPGLSIVLVDYGRPIWRDHLLPAGNLREGRAGMRRADIVIVTKCLPLLALDEAMSITKKLKLSPSQTLYFTTFSYGQPFPLVSNNGTIPLQWEGCDVVAFTALANAKPFHGFLRAQKVRLSIMDLPDHHRFTLEDIQRLSALFIKLPSPNKWIAVTEKDAVKLREMKQISDEIVSRIVVVPIEPLFLFSKQDEFNTQIIDYVGKSQINS